MPRSTPALLLRSLKGPFSLETINIVEPLRENEALVEIHATGICHTDLDCAAGTKPCTAPAVLGHEGAFSLSFIYLVYQGWYTQALLLLLLLGAGIVLQTGSQITHVSPGDKVLLSYSFCGECEQCVSENQAYCQNIVAMNFGGKRREDGTTAFSLPSSSAGDADGGQVHSHFFGQSSFARLAVVNQTSLVKVPAETPLELFAPLGCGLQTGAGAVLNTLNVQPGDSVAVFGAGSVGLSAIMAAKIRQAKQIIAIDIQESRLALAKELGATATILASDDMEAIREQIRKLSPPNGVNKAVDCSGVPKVIETMIDSLGIRGRACTVGSPGPGKRVSVDVFSHLVYGREYIGCHQGSSIAQKVSSALHVVRSDSLMVSGGYSDGSVSHRPAQQGKLSARENHYLL
jgi:Zn-dependent alcohol dehydrogenase